jgi:hypothetical protein
VGDWWTFRLEDISELSSFAKACYQSFRHRDVPFKQGIVDDVPLGAVVKQS